MLAKKTLDLQKITRYSKELPLRQIHNLTENNQMVKDIHGKFIVYCSSCKRKLKPIAPSNVLQSHDSICKPGNIYFSILIHRPKYV